MGFSAYNKTFRTTESCSVALKDLPGEIISLLLPAISSLKCKSLLFQYSRNYHTSQYWQQPREERVNIQVNMNWQTHTNRDIHLHSSGDLLFHETTKTVQCLRSCSSKFANQFGSTDWQLSASPVSTSVNCSVSFVVPFRTSPSLGENFPIQSLASFLFKNLTPWYSNSIVNRGCSLTK